MATSVIPQSRSEKILAATINGEEYNQPPQSRIEQLLIELKEAVEEGGGGGTTVVANPSGEATDEIIKIKIGSTIYSIEGGSGHTIQDAGTNMDQEDALNFIDHDISDDNTNGATVVKPHRLSAEEMSEICSPLPDAPTLVGNMRMSKLWENSNPTQSMSSGTPIATNQSMDNFDLILMVMQMNTSGYFYSTIGVIGSITVCGLVSGGTMVSRQINYVDSTHLSAGTGWSGSTQDSSVAIPYRAYGIKLL